MRSLLSPFWVAGLCVAALACQRQVVVKPSDLTADAAWMGRYSKADGCYS